MAVQILYARKIGKELAFGNLDHTVNMTEFLKEVIGDLFVEKVFFEDDEEISYRVIEYKNIGELVDAIHVSEERIQEELKTVRGNEKRIELVSKLKDLSLLNQVIFKALLQKGGNNAKVIALL